MSLWIEDYSGIKKMFDGLLQTVDRIRKLIAVNNQFYQGPALSMAMGTSTASDSRPFGQAYTEADDRMYAGKGSRR